ncbi:hypothetical protein [Micromonospora schwarzwaldensis]
MTVVDSVEDALDEGGLFGGAGAEVAGGGVEGGVAEQGLSLGRVGATLPETGGVGVAQPVQAQAGQSGVGADGKDDLGDAEGGESAASGRVTTSVTCWCSRPMDSMDGFAGSLPRLLDAHPHSDDSPGPPPARIVRPRWRE